LKKQDFELQPGLVIAVEPMVNAGSRHVRVSKTDHWTVVTRDGRPSVHFEHTIAMTADGPLVLTAL
jgi:methionyl aminopeptidase